MRANDTERLRIREAVLTDRRSRIDAELDPGEQVVADRHHLCVVSDRRCFLVRRRAGDEDPWSDLDGLWFDEVVEWRDGRTHDARPIVRMVHPPHPRRVHAPRHRLLWLRWGNDEVTEPATTTEVRCSSLRDPTYLALIGGLQAAGAAQGPSFQQWPEGTREQRTAASSGLLTRTVYTSRRRWLLRRQGKAPATLDDGEAP